MRVIPDPPNRILYAKGHEQGVWEAPHAGAIAKCLTVTGTLDDVARRIAHTEARSTFLRMIEAGFLEPADGDPEFAGLCRGLDIRLHKVQRNRWAEAVTVMAFHAEIGEAFITALASLRLHLTKTASLVCAVTNDYRQKAVADLVADCQRQGRRLLLVNLTASEAWVGPEFGKVGSPCWLCLASRLRQWHWLETQWPTEIRVLHPPSSPFLQLGASAAALEVARRLLDERIPSNSIWTLKLNRFEARYHSVGRNRSCPVCDRIVEEHDPLERLAALDSGITGVVRNVQCLDEDESGRDVVVRYAAEYAPAIPPPAQRRPGAVIPPGIASGRGRTGAQARTACLAEAVERYSAQFRGDEKRVTGSYRDLERTALHPDRIQLFSALQFEEREVWNAHHIVDHAVPERFDENYGIEWFEGWNWRDRRPHHLPMALCFEGYGPPGTRPVGMADSNGCAAGPTMEEAVVNATLELIERDALSIWWYNRIALPAICMEMLDDPRSQEVRSALERRGWRIRLHNLTTDLMIPVTVAIAENSDGHWLRGSGADFDLRNATRRALEELYQLSNTPPRRVSSPPAVASGHTETVASTIAATTVPASSLAQIDLLRERLNQIGSELIVFDLTRPDVGFPVARAIAPGLRHSKPRFAPGRLFDVPVKLGWLPHGMSEDRFPREQP